MELLLLDEVLLELGELLVLLDDVLLGLLLDSLDGELLLDDVLLLDDEVL